MKKKAKTRAYLRAVAWVAMNDDAANVSDMDTVREGARLSYLAGRARRANRDWRDYRATSATLGEGGR